MNPRAIERVLVVAVVLWTKEYWNSKFIKWKMSISLKKSAGRLKRIFPMK